MKIVLSFSNVRVRKNVFHEEAIADHKMKKYDNTLQDCLRSSNPDLTICKSINHALHSLNPFNFNVVSDGCPIRQPFVTHLSSLD